MDTIYRAWRFLQDKLLGNIAALVMLGVTILANIEIFRRYVEGRTFYWSQDAVTYLLVGAAFLYFGISQATRSHLAVTVLPDWCRRTGRQHITNILRLLACLVSVVFVAGFIWYGIPGAERTMRMGRLTESMIIPLWPFQYLLLVGMGMLLITFLFQLYRDVMILFGRDVFPWDTDHEDFEI